MKPSEQLPVGVPVGKLTDDFWKEYNEWVKAKCPVYYNGASPEATYGYVPIFTHYPGNCGAVIMSTLSKATPKSLVAGIGRFFGHVHQSRWCIQVLIPRTTHYQMYGDFQEARETLVAFGFTVTHSYQHHGYKKRDDNGWTDEYAVQLSEKDVKKFFETFQENAKP